MVPGHAIPKVVRMVLSNRLLSTGFWKKAVAPARRDSSRLDCGSRAVKMMTGMQERCAFCCSRSSTTNPSPAGRPRSRMIRSGRSFCAIDDSQEAVRGVGGLIVVGAQSQVQAAPQVRVVVNDQDFRFFHDAAIPFSFCSVLLRWMCSLPHRRSIPAVGRSLAEAPVPPCL